MKPEEVLERLRYLSTYGKVTTTVIHAPIGPTPSECGYGEVNCGNLIEFVAWVDTLKDSLDELIPK